MIPVQLLNIRYYFLMAPLNMFQDTKQFCKAWGNEKGKVNYAMCESIMLSVSQH